jgi:deoxycytidylate deaminase
MKFFDVARSMAKLSTWSEVPREQTGAVIVLRNEVIAAGYNRRKGNMLHGFFADRVGRPEAAYAHAETSALSKLTKNKWEYNPHNTDFHMMKIYIFRETKQGLGLAKPCDICTLALKSFGITNIFYTTDEGYGYEKWEH